jgi:hypothetical protein
MLRFGCARAGNTLTQACVATHGGASGKDVKSFYDYAHKQGDNVAFGGDWRELL